MWADDLEDISLIGPTLFSRNTQDGAQSFVHETRITIHPNSVEVSVTSMDTGVVASSNITDPLVVRVWREFEAMLRCTREGSCPVELQQPNGVHLGY